MTLFGEEQFVSTYSPVGYDDAAEQIADWRRVRRYVGRNPDKGRVAVGNALDLPPERVRGWLNGGKPDAVHGLQIAQDCGWLNLDPDGPKGRRMALCVVGIFACGTVDSRWVPAWSASSTTTEQQLWSSLSALGLQPQHRHADSTDRPTEVTVGNDGAVFGRCLVAAGAPQGNMNAENSPPLPDWLFEAGRYTREQCAELILLERGTMYDDKDTVSIQTGRRSEAYRTSLKRLFESLTDESVTAGTNVTISAAAARDLGVGRGQELRESA